MDLYSKLIVTLLAVCVAVWSWRNYLLAKVIWNLSERIYELQDRVMSMERVMNHLRQTTCNTVDSEASPVWKQAKDTRSSISPGEVTKPGLTISSASSSD